MKKLIFWAPRILSILFILFLMLFSLDVFGMEGTLWEKIGGFLIHNIPVIFLGVILAIAWRFEIVGAIFYSLAGLSYMIILFSSGFEMYKLSWSLLIAGPAFLIGILFFLGWTHSSKRSKI